MQDPAIVRFGEATSVLGAGFIAPDGRLVQFNMGHDYMANQLGYEDMTDMIRRGGYVRVYHPDYYDEKFQINYEIPPNPTAAQKDIMTKESRYFNRVFYDKYDFGYGHFSTDVLREMPIDRAIRTFRER